MKIFFWLCVPVILLLQGCGFEPVYGEKQSEQYAGSLPKVEVEVERGRNAQILKMALDDRMNPGGLVAGAPDYRVTFKNLTSEPVAVVIEGNATVQRFNVAVNADFELWRLADNKMVLKGHAKRLGSFNASRQFFADYEAQTDVSDRAIRELAADMDQRIHAFLISPPKDYKLPDQPVPKGEGEPATPQDNDDWYKKKNENYLKRY